MVELHRYIRRESKCSRADFIQRIRAGLFGAAVILFAAGGWAWLV